MMQAVKALYKHGKIELLEPLQGVEDANLFIVVLDKSKQSNGVVQSFISAENNSEEAFKAIGLTSYFDTDEDNNVDWEEVFNVNVIPVKTNVMPAFSEMTK